VTYLQSVYETWKQILQEETHYLDFGTVQALQMRNPAHSQVDFIYIKSGMQKGELFPRISDDRLRGAILERLQKIDFSIPSLYTFFEDTKWLEPCAKILRGLLPAKFRGSIRKAMLQRYNGLSSQNNCCVELSNRTYNYIKFDIHDTATLAYYQLWMYAWRHFPCLATIAPRKDTGASRPEIKERNPLYIQHLATLAQKLGFESKEITALTQASCESIITYEYLSRVRPTDLYQDSPQQRAKIVVKFVNFLNSFEPAIETVHPLQNVEVPIAQRCGRPYQVSYDLTKPYFFAEFIYRRPANGSMCHFLVNKDIFGAFFGRTHPFISETVQHELYQAMPKPVQENPGSAALTNTGFKPGEQLLTNVQPQTMNIEEEEDLFDTPADQPSTAPEEDIEMTDFDRYATDQGDGSRQLLFSGSEDGLLHGNHIMFFDPDTEDLYAIAGGNDQRAQFDQFLSHLLDAKRYFMVRQQDKLVTVPSDKLYDLAQQSDRWIFTRQQSNDGGNWQGFESDPKKILRRHRQDNPLKRKRAELRRKGLTEKVNIGSRISKQVKAPSKPKPQQDRANKIAEEEL